MSKSVGTDQIEQFTQKRVIRIKPPKDLLQIIEDQGNYLPSARQRFCTQTAKIKPYKLFIKALEAKYPDSEFISLVGIRADESAREGVSWTEGNITSIFPLRQLGLVKADVNRIVNEVVGIPTYYASRTRSGCFTCFFQRRSEIIGMFNIEQEGMRRAAQSECLPAEYEAVLQDLPQSLSGRLGIARNWLKMAVPADMGSTKMNWSNDRGIVREANGHQADFFSAGNKTFFVAVEHHFGPTGMNGQSQVYYQRLITYSTSLGGLKTALKHHWLHRGNTLELFGITSEEAMRRELKIGIYVVEIHDGIQQLPEAPIGVYTWQSDRQPISFIKKASYLLEQTLLEEGLLQDARGGDSWAQKQLFNMKGQRTGQVLHGSLYEPLALHELVTDIDITDAPVACNACSR